MPAGRLPNHYADYSDYEKAIWRKYLFRPAWNARPCPRTLSRKKRCSLDSSCICTMYREGLGVPDFLDHAYRWVDQNGFAVMTAEPYLPTIERHPEEFEEFVYHLHYRLDLKYSFGNYSPWCATRGNPDDPTDSSPGANPRSATQLILITPNNPLRANRFHGGPVSTSELVYRG